MNIERFIFVSFLISNYLPICAQNLDLSANIENDHISFDEEFVMTISIEGDINITQVQFSVKTAENIEFVNMGSFEKPLYGENMSNSQNMLFFDNLVYSSELMVTLLDTLQVGTKEKTGDVAKVYLRSKDNKTMGNSVVSIENIVASDKNGNRYSLSPITVDIKFANIDTSVSCAFEKESILTGAAYVIDPRGLLYMNKGTSYKKGIYIINGRKVTLK